MVTGHKDRWPLVTKTGGHWSQRQVVTGHKDRLVIKKGGHWSQRQVITGHKDRWSLVTKTGGHWSQRQTCHKDRWSLVIKTGFTVNLGSLNEIVFIVNLFSYCFHKFYEVYSN